MKKISIQTPMKNRSSEQTGFLQEQRKPRAKSPGKFIQNLLSTKSAWFAISFFVVSLAGSVALASYSIYTNNQIFSSQLKKNLEDVAQSSTSQVNIFLKGKKERAVDFASDGFIKNRLKENSSEKTMQILSEHLIKNKIIVDESFYEVFVLDINGKIVGTTNPEEEFGEDFSDDLVFLEGKKSPYIKNIFYEEEFERYGIALSAPVLREEEFVGVVVIRMSLDQLIDIVVDAGNFEEYGQVYLIDKDSLMTTPSKFLKGENKGVLTQKVDTVNSQLCLDEFKKYAKSGKVEGHEYKVISFLDYRGEDVLGIHYFILETDWCLLAEIDKEIALSIPQRKFFRNQVLISLLIVVTLTLCGYFIGKYVENKFRGIKR